MSHLSRLVSAPLSAKYHRQFCLLIKLLLVGELFGLHSLHQLLSSYGIASHNLHKVWQRLSCADVVSYLNQCLWHLFEARFAEVLGKSGSTHSREKLTLVIDSSIFKQWLPKEQLGQYFAKYFSGQSHSTVYGLNLILCGMVIGELFYPLHFQLRPKAKTDVAVAESILERVHNKLSYISQKTQTPLPFLYLSVDSGFRSPRLLEICKHRKIIYIGVPKTSHVVYLEEQKLTIKDLIKQYEQQQKAHSDTHDPDSKAYQWRVRVHYHCIGQEVTLLLFRLKGSKKVSVIFSPDLDIKRKTLRRHWFERTKIEALFRSIKHSLKIARSTTRDRLTFLKKIALFLLKAIMAQLFTQRVKKQHPSLQRWGYEHIRAQLAFHNIGRQALDRIVSRDLLQQKT